MAAGRPREYDLKKVANDLIEWAKKDDSINLNKFCAHNDIVPSTMLRWKDEDKEFREAYDKTKSYIAFRREEQLSKGKLHVKAYDLNATVYDAFSRDEKMYMAKYEADVKKVADESQKQIIIEAVNYATAKCSKDKAPL
jgi:hypothetical protein